MLARLALSIRAPARREGGIKGRLDYLPLDGMLWNVSLFSYDQEIFDHCSAGLSTPVRSEPATAVGQVVNADLCGPMTLDLLGGAIYRPQRSGVLGREMRTVILGEDDARSDWTWQIVLSEVCEPGSVPS